MEIQGSFVDKIVIVSGGFDPIHAGHISMIRHARSLGDWLIVGVNSDDWLTRKKGRAFMPWQHRSEIISNVVGVDEVLSFDDSDGSACDLLLKARQKYPAVPIIFANGGDRTEKNIPEMSLAEFEFAFGIGGNDKIGSSSDFLKNWKQPAVQRSWGEYRVIYENKSEICTKVKELVVDPGKSLSLQRHQHRGEYWFVADGDCKVLLQKDDDKNLVDLTAGQDLLIQQGEWHRLTNPYKSPCKIIEIQFGSRCEESDIERCQMGDITNNS